MNAFGVAVVSPPVVRGGVPPRVSTVHGASMSTTEPTNDRQLAATVQVCIDTIALLADGDRGAFERLVHPQARNRESVDEPPTCRVPGPAGFHAAAQWLRTAFTDLTFDVHDAVAQGDLVVVHVTMRGRHTGPMVVHRSDGTVREVFPPTGNTFASTQTHWFRLADDLVVEHWANRDDIGTAHQLGWVPRSPSYLVRMAAARGRARRAALRADADG
jgi:predicted ester cyclase